jgi:gas vesicle protein
MDVTELINSALRQPIVSLLIGAAIGIAANYYFARQSSIELSNEASNLKSRINELAHLMDEAGLVEATFNEEGDLVRVVRLRGRIEAKGQATMEAEGRSSDHQPEDPGPG